MQNHADKLPERHPLGQWQCGEGRADLPEPGAEFAACARGSHRRSTSSSAPSLDVAHRVGRWAHNRFTEGRDDGRTPRDRAGWQRQSLVLEFGEVVNFIPVSAEARSDKFDAKLRKGIWLGLDGRTDESLVGTKYGIYRTATIKPSAEDARWSVEKVLAVIGMP